MGQLHEVLAVVASCKGAAQKIHQETAQVFGNKKQLFDGMFRSYKPDDEEGETLPDESSPLTTTVGEKLSHYAEIVAPFIDASYQVDMTNLGATATVEVEHGGQKLVIENVPSTFLMQLDKRLGEIRSAYNAIPTLDPKYEWSPDEDKGQGVHKANPVKTNRTAKVLQSKVLYEAKGPHPAQIEKWTADHKIGEWTTQHYSGMVTPAQKYELLKRIDLLQRAVKRALANANRVEHSTDRVASRLFGFINGDLPLER